MLGAGSKGEYAQDASKGRGILQTIEEPLEACRGESRPEELRLCFSHYKSLSKPLDIVVCLSFMCSVIYLSESKELEPKQTCYVLLINENGFSPDFVHFTFCFRCDLLFKPLP